MKEEKEKGIVYVSSQSPSKTGLDQPSSNRPKGPHDIAAAAR
jgi:hypothetical protein